MNDTSADATAPAPAREKRKPTPGSRRDRERDKMRVFRPTVSSYYEPVKVKLYSPHTQKAYDYGLPATAHAVYQIDVMLRIRGRTCKQQVAEFNGKMIASINATKQALDEDIEKYSRLLNDAGIASTTERTYSHPPKEYEPQLFTPVAVSLLHILQKLDEAIYLVDRARWNGIVDGEVWSLYGIERLRDVMRCFRKIQDLHVQGVRAIDNANQRAEKAQKERPARRDDASNAAPAPATSDATATDVPAADPIAPEATAELDAAPQSPNAIDPALLAEVTRELAESDAAAPEAAQQLAEHAATLERRLGRSPRRRAAAATDATDAANDVPAAATG